MTRFFILFACLFIVACSSESSTDDNNDAAPDLGADLNAGDVRTDADSMPEFVGGPTADDWLAGDFHVHATGASNDTGGDSTPERIKEVAIERGLDFVVLTDHSNSTGSDPTTRDEDPDLFNMGPEFPYWDRAATLSDETFLMIDGNEISPVDDGDPPSQPTGHVGCYPRDLETFDTEYAFTDRPRGTVTGAETIVEAREAGCWVTINHPNPLFPWIGFDWSSDDYDALEVYNGSAGYDQSDHDAMLSLICDLSLGRDVAAIGGSDNHRVNIEPPGDTTNPPLGFPKTWILAESLEWDAIMQAMDAHRIVISDTDEPLVLSAHGDDGEFLATVGDTTRAQSAWLRVTGSSSGAGAERRLMIIEIAPDTCNDTRMTGSTSAPEPAFETLEDLPVEPDQTFERAFRVDLKPGHAYLAWLRPERREVIDELGTGITNPIRVEP